MTRYVPSLSGDLDAMRRQVELGRERPAIDTVLIAPMIAGLSNLHRLVRDNPDIAFVAHPTLAGAARIAPPLLFGKLFRLFGADAFIYPNHGGRFGYSPQTCRALARAGLADWNGLAPSVPVPAGGMSRSRVAEMLDFYGADVMLLIGGSLLGGGRAAHRGNRRLRRRGAPACLYGSIMSDEPAVSSARPTTTIAGRASSASPTRRTRARCSGR